jgi:hypothetical protein
MWCEVVPDAVVGFTPNGSGFSPAGHWLCICTHGTWSMEKALETHIQEQGLGMTA